MILLIDNYDSFTFNLMHLIGGLGEDVVVRRNDKITASEAFASGADAVFLSPGPCTPDDAGICLDVVAQAALNGTPVFGVCLGMQSIAQALGGTITRADKLMHGKTCGVVHDGGWLLGGAPSPFISARYHSLVAAPDTLPDSLEVVATADDDGEIMAVAHKTLPIAGVQFHPESIASAHGETIIANFLKRARAQGASV
jgi:anthranilate synthase component 2